ncbi:YceI family protein [Chryseolinea sp. H1M3-3]|uniref:YceI family protein n=1 Tax=Chryseolinea sp. H1M3-3 TaxID=3034144 RepID=UPI0023EAE818|nr:YceI family protein [Chryseolinea sp. H1M3-3]
MMYNKLIVLVLGFGCLNLTANAQKFTTEKTFVSFFSHAAIEDIKAENTKTAGVFNSATGDIAFSVPIKEYEFEKSLMKEHFNEKYMETEKYPKSTFQGKVSGYDANATGTQNVTSKGKLTIHGVTQEVEIPGTIEKEGDKLLMKSKFIVKLADYKIAIPQLLWQNIAEQVEVTADFTFKPQ